MAVVGEVAAASAAYGRAMRTEEITQAKAAARAMWALGDYHRFATQLVWEVGPVVVEAAGIRPGMRVLDVAAGTGNVAVRAAEAGAEVVASDLAPENLAAGRAAAAARGLELEWVEADAEALPFADGAFDVVTSAFGVMFAPDHRAAARELLRVCRPGGTIALAHWAPDGFIGRVFKTIGAHNPPPAGVASPALWGTEDHLRSLFGTGISQLRTSRRDFNFRYHSADHWLDVFRTFYGPMLMTFDALGDAGRDALARDLRGLMGELNRSADRLVVPSTYLEVVATRS